MLIREAPDFEVATDPRLALLTFRFLPEWAENEAEIERVNEELLRRLNEGGQLYLSKARANGRIVIRFVIGQTYTTWRHVEQGWSTIEESARRIPKPAQDA